MEVFAYDMAISIVFAEQQEKTLFFFLQLQLAVALCDAIAYHQNLGAGNVV